MTISTVLHNRVPLFCMASHEEVMQGCQRIPSGEVTAFNRWTPQLSQKRKKGERKEKKKKVGVVPKNTPYFYTSAHTCT